MKKKKKDISCSICNVHINSTFNNIIITLSNLKGDVLAWSSAGQKGFKGAKKNTPYAASKTAQDIVEKGKKMVIKKINIIVKGPGAGREAAIRTLSNLNVIRIKDMTPIPHNGCRPPKKRRI
ncbi:MAG: 30S ribosomal protein S11 [Candidatus Karelsulcia muelleri]